MPTKKVPIEFTRDHHFYREETTPEGADEGLKTEQWRDHLISYTINHGGSGETIREISTMTREQLLAKIKENESLEMKANGNGNGNGNGRGKKG